MEKNNDYLHKLEDKLHRPLIDYTENSEKYPSKNQRIQLIDWLYDVNKKRPLCFFGLTITLIDIYFSLETDDVPQEEWQAIGCMCLSIVESMLLGDMSITKYSGYIYLTDNAYTKEDFVKARSKIVTVLNGYLIRPSQVFFINVIGDSRIKSLITFSYYISDLMIYKPSLIAEVINFILTGKHKKYNLEEISEPCRILNTAINDYDLYITGKLASEILDIKKYLKANCGEHISKIEDTKKYKDINIQKYRFDEYEKLNMIGEGAFSKVYKIKQNNNFYAVKYYEKPQLINEIACLKLLSSKNNNIITLEDFKMHEDGAFLFFEYAEYNLNQIIVMKTILYQKKLIDYKTIILPLFQDLLKAVSYCHYNDVIHGDIKPVNIVWVNDHLKLIDLGSSLPCGSYRKNYSNVMLPKRITTVTYRAPEIFLDNRHYTEKIDIWSMGLVFYFIITGSTLLNTESYSDKEMIETIFFIFGVPNEKTWPGVTKFDNWKNIYETYNYKFQKKFFEDKLALENSKYYSIVTECLHLNPNDRPNAKDLLKRSEILR